MLKVSRLWESASYIGTKSITHLAQKRSIVMTNRLAVIIAIFPLIYSAFSIINNPSGGSIGFVFSLAFLSILLLNHFQLFSFSRLAMALIPPLGIMFYNIWAKGHNTTIHEFNYLSPRIAILGSSVIPLMIFRLKERYLLTISSGAYVMSLIFFDQIHDFYHVGFNQAGFTLAGYSYLNFAFIVNQFIIISATLVLKNEIEKSQLLNQNLLKDLEYHNQEIQAQAEELQTNQDRLMDALDTIEKQKQELENQNQHLQLDLVEKDTYLISTNNELLKQNERLKQFSYSISHNLRAPVARVLGLAELLKMNFSDDFLKKLVDSTQELDDVVKDFNKIIDLGNDIYKIKERVDLQDEWMKVKSFLASYLSQIDDVEIVTDFTRCPYLFSIRPLINNMIYNLISNAIKFRSHDRKLIIRFESGEDDNAIYLTVSDNGIGFDPNEVGKDLFKMYKRFHSHVTGKGLGLYLVKVQTELLDGNIKVHSEKNKGTTFTITLAKTTEVDYQLCYENNAATIYYNAFINAAWVKWKTGSRSHNAIEETYMKFLEISRAYHIPNWIWDQHTRTHLNADQIKWVLEKIIPDAIKKGLKKIAVLKTKDSVLVDPHEETIREVAKQIGFKVNFFSDIKQTNAWLHDAE